MKTIDIDQLQKERQQLSNRIQQIDALLSAVAAFDGSGPRKVGRPKGGKGQMSAAGRARIAEAQRKRWAKVRAAKK